MHCSFGEASELKKTSPSLPVLTQITSGKLVTETLLPLTNFSSPCVLFWVNSGVFWVNFLMWSEVWSKVHLFFPMDIQRFIIFIENTILPILNCLHTFVENQLCTWVCIFGLKFDLPLVIRMVPVNFSSGIRNSFLRKKNFFSNLSAPISVLKSSWYGIFCC